MTGATTACKYSCALCRVHRVTVEVPARTMEDVVVWMECVCIPALMEDHARRSPFCNPREFSEVMVPITGTSKIGGPVEN